MVKIDKKEKENRVLKTLKDFGKQPTSKISSITGINFYKLKDTLNRLKSENKIKKIELGNLATYWELKNNEEKETKA